MMVASSSSSSSSCPKSVEPPSRTTICFYRNRPDTDDDCTDTSAVSLTSSSSSSLRADDDDDTSIESLTFSSANETTSRWTTVKTGNLNLTLIRNVCLSQVLLVTAAFGLSQWQGVVLDPLYSITPTSSSFVLTFPWTVVLLLGCVAAYPMIATTHDWIDRNNDDPNNDCHPQHRRRRNQHYVQFATTDLVLQLFGRRHYQQQQQRIKEEATNHGSTTHQVFWASAVIGAVTAVAEEVVFRGILPLALVQLLGLSWPMALIVQAFMFGGGHYYPKSSWGENQLIVQTQTVNGLWQGLLLGASGGNLAICILSHFVYDWHVLVSTWHQINNQVDYTEQAFAEPLSEDTLSEISKLTGTTAHAMHPETIDVCRRFFYAFDSQHVQSLSLNDIQRAVSYAFLQDAIVPSEEQVQQVFENIVGRANRTEEQMRLRLPEFVQLLFTLRSHVYAQQKAQGQSTSVPQIS